jgi:Na+/melibiose symporter-like transporter
VSARASWPSLAAYGTLRMPLALLELPLFVLLPSFYSRSLGVDLATIGAVLFASRLVDAAADPFIGATIDRWRARFDYRRWIWAALPVLVAGFAAMFTPPTDGGLLAAWLAASSMVTYLAYSVVSIAYQSWGACLGDTSAERARVTATREAFGLLGVVAASALLAPEHARTLVFAVAGLGVLTALAIGRAPMPAVVAPGRTDAASVAPAGLGALAAWREVFGNRAWRWLLAAFVLNGIATAIPATLVLFFVRDVLGADDRASAMFLIAYFVAGAAGMPLWVWAARRFGLRNAWLLGMAFAVIAFVGALGLGRGDVAPFMAVCVLTGLALGSDLAIPPAMLAAVIADAGHSGRREGAYFGVWNLATKLNLAIAAGVALPLLGWIGYAPGGQGGTLALSLTYAALPSALKLAAGLIVLLAPFPDSAPQVRARAGVA